MENKQFPEQEDASFLPEDLEALPLSMDPLDGETPVFEELSYDAELPVIEEIPFAEETSITADLPAREPAPEAPAREDLVFEPQAEETPVPPPQEPLPEPELPLIPEELPPGIPAVPFMERIPDTDADYPEEKPELPAESSPEEAPEAALPGEEDDFSGTDFPELLVPDAISREEALDQEYRDTGAEFDEMFHAPAPEKKQPEPHSTVRKGRPKRKKGEGLLGIPNILVTVVWLALIVAIGVTAGRMLWVCAADVLAFGREDKVVTLTIYEADTMDDIIDKLQENGLIRYKSLFKLYADISDAEEDIQPGIYDLNTRYDYHALVNFMSPRSSREVIDLTIPEGYTCRQIFALLEENRICTAVDIAAYAANGELSDYWFLDGLTRGNEYCLEGYLFPDTYEFYKNSTPKEALERMLDNFEAKFSEELRAQLDALNANVTGGTYGVREVVIVASLIEKESAAPAESPTVAGVIYNRLFNWGATPAYLNIDASIVYAQGGDAEHIDTSLDSPYNTYTNVGLTPGPISNPGLSSIKAALNPESHNYYYYVLNPSTGMHQFSTTQDEHNAWITQFYG